MATDHEKSPNLAEARRAIGERIVEARKENGMRQLELAELLGVAERTMQAYESGEVAPYRRLKDLERFLGKPMAWFLHGEAAVDQRHGQLDEIHNELKQIVAANKRRDEMLSELLSQFTRIADRLDG